MKKKKIQFDSKDMQKKLLRIAGVLGMVVILLAGFTFAKYMNEQKSNNYIGRPAGFYFESDYLTVNDASHNMQNWNKGKDYNFVIDIRNFQDTLKSAEMDITYTLDITGLKEGNVSATLNDKKVTADSTFILSANSPNTDSLLITVPAGKIPSNNTITITATAQANGYKKELKGIFTLDENESSFEATLENHRDYYDLLVGVAKNNQKITVTWPTSLTPDTTVSGLEVDNATSGYFITTKEDSSIRLRFFVTGNKNENDKFTVNDGNSSGSKTVEIPLSQAN